MPNLMGMPQMAAPPPDGQVMDAQEMTDRQAAATATAAEDPQHFVTYGEACLRESREANADVRKIWDATWRAYQLKRDYAIKEDWQSRLVTPEPLFLAQQAKAIIRKAFDRQNLYDIGGVEPTDEAKAQLWRLELDFHLNATHANLPLVFADACEMAFVTGQSSEILPRWGPRPGGTEGLTLDLIEPWKIFRSPDARPRDPWSGQYWIHQEWMDKADLAASGQYQQLDEAAAGGGEGDEREKDRRRKEQVWVSPAFRKYLQVNEFYGRVYSREGELLLPKAQYAFAGGVLIRPPQAVPYPTMPWPGLSFSPIPHLIRFEGRGLLEGVLGLWATEDNLLNMTLDDFNWIVNRMFEIDPSLLLDGGKDAEVYPGKTWWKKVGTAGVPAIREVLAQRGKTEALTMLDYLEKRRQNGAFVNPFVAGLPGTRSDITLGETEIKTQQSLGVFESIGTELEAGAVWTIRACMEVLSVHWTTFSTPSIQQALGPAAAEFASLGLLQPEERMQELRLNADITVRGISALLRRTAMLQRLDALMQRAEQPMWAPFVKPYEMLRAAVEALDLGAEGLIKTPQEVQAAMPPPGAAPATPGQAVAPGPSPSDALVREALAHVGLPGAHNGGPHAPVA